MYVRFTDRAKKIMQLANEEAGNRKCQYIGTEHFLLGLIEEGDGVASRVLREFKIDKVAVNAEISKLTQTRLDADPPDTLPRVPKIKRIIDSAIKDAMSLGHDYVGTEHLLLGLLRNEETVAVQIILNLDGKLNDIRDRVLGTLRAP